MVCDHKEKMCRDRGRVEEEREKGGDGEEGGRMEGEGRRSRRGIGEENSES